MQSATELPPEDYATIAEKIRSGEFFRESRNMYDVDIHDPMTERYLYLLITSLAAIILLVAIIAARGLYPLQTSVPFIVSTHNIVDDLPKIESMLTYSGQDPGDALLHFMVRNYVTMREEYDIETFDRNMNGVQSQSSQEVFKNVQQLVDPRNPESPITLYQRHSKRHISIISSTVPDGETPSIEVVYEAMVDGQVGAKKSRWQANIAFNYSGIELDENGKVKPISFMITQYRTKRLQDIQ